MVEELERIDVRRAVATAALLLLSLGSLHFAFGLSGLITLTVVVAFLIITISACGCALHLREIEKLQEAESLDSVREKADSHAQSLYEILSPARSRLAELHEHILQRPGIADGAIHNFEAARRLVEALEERLNTLLTLLNSGRADDLLKADELTDSSLTIASDSLHAVSSSEPMPPLEQSLWSETVEMLLNQVESQLRLKPAAAA